MSLRILHVIPSTDPTHGGPSATMWAIGRALEGSDRHLTMATIHAKEMDAATPGNEAFDEGGWRIHSFPETIRFYTVSVPLWRWLRANISSFDVVHIHALFSFSTTAAAYLARRRGIPYVIRPLGTLSRLGMNQRKLLKRISYRLVESRLLEHAFAIQFSTQQELDSVFRKMDLPRTAIIPNPVLAEVATPAAQAALLDRFPILAQGDVVLFLSRLEPEKGAHLMLEAFAELKGSHPRALLFLVGVGRSDSVDELRRRVEALGLSDRVVWGGFLAGPEKWAALALARVLVFPSLSDSFGVVAVEALAAGVPLVISEEVGLAPTLASEQAGLVVKSDPQHIASALRQLLDDENLRETLVERGVELFRVAFDHKTVGASLLALYERAVAENIRSVGPGS